MIVLQRKIWVQIQNKTGLFWGLWSEENIVPLVVAMLEDPGLWGVRLFQLLRKVGLHSLRHLASVLLNPGNKTSILITRN